MTIDHELQAQKNSYTKTFNSNSDSKNSSYAREIVFLVKVQVKARFPKFQLGAGIVKNRENKDQLQVLLKRRTIPAK
jgi:hypothetical protein